MCIFQNARERSASEHGPGQAHNTLLFSTKRVPPFVGGKDARPFLVLIPNIRGSLVYSLVVRLWNMYDRHVCKSVLDKSFL